MKKSRTTSSLPAELPRSLPFEATELIRRNPNMDADFLRSASKPNQPPGPMAITWAVTHLTEWRW